MTLFTIDMFQISTIKGIGFVEHILLNATIIPEKELNNSSAVMNIITKVANILKEKLYKTYGSPIEHPYLSKPYHALYYFLDELGREKIYVGTFPENTHYLREYLKSPEKYKDKTLMDVFFDEGSPIRHIYLIMGSSRSYTITGIGCQHIERYDMMVKIPSLEEPFPLDRPFPMEEYENKIKSNDIYIIPGYPKYIAPNIRKYLSNILQQRTEPPNKKIQANKENTNEYSR